MYYILLFLKQNVYIYVRWSVFCDQYVNKMNLLEKTLEKIERAIKNGQSRETGNNGYARHKTKAKDKQRQKTKIEAKKTFKKHNITQKTKRMSNTVFSKGKQFLQLAYCL